MRSGTRWQHSLKNGWPAQPDDKNRTKGEEDRRTRQEEDKRRTRGGEEKDKRQPEADNRTREGQEEEERRTRGGEEDRREKQFRGAASVASSCFPKTQPKQ